MNHSHKNTAQPAVATVALALAISLFSGCSEPAPRGANGSTLAGENTFFVAAGGDDQWSGRLPKPNFRRTDGPFATLARGVEAARNGTDAAPRRIYVRDGRHFLEETVVLTADDSGLTIAAYPGETPVLSGGRPITGWQEVTIGGRTLWSANVPEARENDWSFRQLWVNGRRAVRARHPNQGYLKVAELPDATAQWTDGHARFRFHPGDASNWPSATNAEVIVMTRWVESRLPVVSVDEPERMLSFGKRSVFQLAPGDLYYVEHAFELLDAPGEWYLDAARGLIHYLPLPGEELRDIRAIAPVLMQLVRMEGQPEREQYIENVTFRGLTFAHNEWYFPESSFTDKNKPHVWPPPERAKGGFAQAAIGVPGAVWGEGVRAAVFENCRFVQLGSYALELARGCISNRISRCEFADLGGGGIKIGETRIRDQTAEIARANELSDCHIHDGGKMFHSAIGVWIGQSPGNRITHNLIHDFYYTGISIGWTWGYDPRALATNNVVAFNHVHHIGVQSDGDGPILSDMGGIYTLGMQPGTRVVNNLWHDIAGFRYGGWGIYFDEGSSSIIAESNVVYRTTHGGFHQHYGATNAVRNNVFAFARDHQVQRTRPEPHSSFSFRTNIVYFDKGVPLGGNWSGDKFDLDWNVYFDARPGAAAEAMRFAGAPLEKWRERGHDRNSLVADPLFVDSSKDDFRLRATSPAFTLGFRPIDLQSVGIRPETRR